MFHTRAVTVSLAALLVLFGVAACGSGDGSGAPKTVVQTVTGGAPPEDSTSEASTTAADTSSAPAPSDDSFVMPNEVGKNLQQAQDHVQTVSGNPLFYTTSKDATGAGRFQVLDRNWTVCGQNVAPGTKANADSDIEFSVVKDDETCP